MHNNIDVDHGQGHLSSSLPRYRNLHQYGTFIFIQDPYCILKIGNEKHRTRTKDEAGKKPVWNETFTIKSLENEMLVRVQDEDTFSDDLVGEGKVNLSKFRNNSYDQDGNNLLRQRWCS